MVEKDLHKFFPLPSEDERKLPDFNAAQPVVQKILDYLTKNKMNFQKIAITEVFKKVKEILL